MIECTTLFGKKKLVSPDKLIIRPAAYGIIRQVDEILLVNTKSTGKWFFPGGGLEKGEDLHEALRREVWEETGIKVTPRKFFQFIENFFYYDPHDTAYHNFSFFYLCDYQDSKLDTSHNVAGDEANKAQWLAMDSLRVDDFQGMAGQIFESVAKSGV